MPEHRQDEVSCPRRLAREYYAEMMEMRRRALVAEEECREAEREISELMAAKFIDLMGNEIPAPKTEDGKLRLDDSPVYAVCTR